MHFNIKWIMEYRKIIEVQFKEYDRRILEKSWEWLNDPEIKRLMFSPEITKDSQESWFQSLNERSDYHVEGVWRDDEPIGVLGLKKINSNDAEIFGYIGEKKYWGKAIGMDMMQRLLDYGRSLGLTSIYAQIRKDNPSSYKLHRRYGFEKEKDVSDTAIMMRKYLT